MNLTLKTELLWYQVPAFEKLKRIKVGALLLPMGRGKTRTALQLVKYRENRISRVIIFCPCKVRETFEAEIYKHIYNPCVYLFNDKTSSRTLPKDLDFYIIGIESLSTSNRIKIAAASLVDSRAMVILDESPYIKAHYAIRTKWIMRIGEVAGYRLLMTGTIITQGIIDLYAQMKFLSWQILGYKSFYTFRANHLEYSKTHKDLIVRTHNTDIIAAKMAPYVYQVTDEECDPLPQKLYIERFFRMTDIQKKYYDQAKEEAFEDDFDTDDWSSVAIFRLFTALQQITCGFWHRKRYMNRQLTCDEMIDFPHNRLDVLDGYLEEVEPDEQVVIWAKYIRCIDEIVDTIERNYSGGVVRFDGSITGKQCSQNLRTFENGDVRFFVATPGSAGHGLNELVCSRYSIFYTNEFRMSNRLQAEDRQTRIGQSRSVVYADVTCRDSIDGRIMQAQADKQNVMTVFRNKIRIRDKKTMKQAINAL
jgi:SNF2 family DNA or RNA helicase